MGDERVLNITSFFDKAPHRNSVWKYRYSYLYLPFFTKLIFNGIT